MAESSIYLEPGFAQPIIYKSYADAALIKHFFILYCDHNNTIINSPVFSDYYTVIFVYQTYGVTGY